MSFILQVFGHEPKNFDLTMVVVGTFHPDENMHVCTKFHDNLFNSC